MNHYKARQHQDTGKYAFTSANKRSGAYAVGYCADHGPIHSTPEEAQECYRQYQLDNRLNFHPPKSGPGHYEKCAECDALTDGYASIGGISTISLCQDHQTREVAEKHFKGTVEAWSSF